MTLRELPFQGQSMDPLFKKATSVVVDFFDQPLDSKESSLDLGSVILYKESRGGEWLCHRYIGMKGQKIVLKGDFNTTCDLTDHVYVWGIVRGFVKNNEKYELRPFLGKAIFCFLEKRQCFSNKILFKKIYRLMSRGLLLVNKLFLVRK